MPPGPRRWVAASPSTSVLDVGRTLAERVPVIVMCYANPILARGLERFADALVAIGASGLIVPDLPFEEALGALEVCDARGLALVPLVAPTTPPERMQAIGARGPRVRLHRVGDRNDRRARRRSTGATWPASCPAPRPRRRCRWPSDSGSGRPQQAAGAADAGASGVIIGSRLVRAAGESADPAAEVGRLVREFSAALTG